MQAVRQVARLLSRQGARSYHAPSKHIAPNMSELPVPCGSWKEAYAAKQRANNTVLVAGVSFFVFSVLCAKTSGLIYLNWAPPKSLD